jgi:hypothetical protein
MRASPACQVVLERFGVWRGAVLALALLAMLCVATWLARREPPIPLWMLGAAAAAVVAMIALLYSLWRIPARHLRWDGQVWLLAEPAGRPTGEVAGELTVVIDLGPWMLLRFAPGGSTRAVWLPAQRRGLEAKWHALRCAVYSPRPAAEQ